jgi:hypothetical protein
MVEHNDTPKKKDNNTIRIISSLNPDSHGNLIKIRDELHNQGLRDADIIRLGMFCLAKERKIKVPA